MRYTQLRAFHYVATCGGFSRAAEALFLTQPAISDQVRQLEETYDILLFNRQKRQIVLTDKGHQLLKTTNQMFDAEAQALDFLNETRALTSGTLRIFVDSAYHITPLLKAFQLRYPAIKIALKVGNSAAVTQALYSYKADIGVLGEQPETNDFEAIKLGSTPIVTFAAKSSPHFGKTKISWQELAKAQLVMREQGSKTRQKLEQAASVAGVVFVPAIEAEGREAVREIVAAGNGIGFVSTAEFGQDERLFSLTLPSPAPTMQESLICVKARRERRLIRAFFELAKKSNNP